LYGSPNIIRAIKLRRMRWFRHVACMGQMRSVYKIFVTKPEGKNHLEDLDIDVRISEWISGKHGGKV